MRPLFFLIFLSLLTSNLCAGEVRISGFASGAGGKELRVYGIDDQVSGRKMKLGSTRISSSETFELVFPLERIGQVFIFIDFHRAELWLEPDQDYVLRIGGMDLDNYREEINPFLTPSFLDMILMDSLAHALPVCYDSLNALSDDYLRDNVVTILRRGLPEPPDSLISHWQRHLPCAGVFIETAIRYRVAQLSISGSRRNMAGIFKQYIKDRPVWPEHPDYMRFFSQYFDKHLFTSRSLAFHELLAIINGHSAYSALLDFLGRDSLLRDARIRELVLLTNTRELFYHPDINQDAVLEILAQMVRTTRDASYRRIASNLIQELERLRRGTEAPPFSIISLERETITLESFKEKYLYIQFFTSWCTSCVADMLLIENLQKEFGEHIHFLSISVDLEPARLQAMLQRYRFPWVLAHYDGDYDLLEAYQVRAYPTYILIDPQGRIAAAPALSPQEEVAVYFSRMLMPLRRP